MSKLSLSIATLSLSLLIPNIAQAATCTKTITQKPTYTQKDIVMGVNGNWGPQHNTRKWNYQTVKGGKDYYLHRKGRRTVGLHCKDRSARYVVDYHANGRDACVKTVRKAHCSAGFSLYLNGCTKRISTQATSSIRTKAYPVKGNWNPIHDTRKWNYQTVQGGKDYYLHRKGRRTVGLLCRSGTGNYTVDHYPNGRDACVKKTRVYHCPSGYSLSN